MKKLFIYLLLSAIASCLIAVPIPLNNADWNTLRQTSDPDFVWQQFAPGDGGTCWYLRIHPSDAQCVLQSCDMTSTYITHDGSRSYTSVNDPDADFPRVHYVSGADFSLSAPDIGYAATESNGIFKTLDRGRSWRELSTYDVEKIFGGKFAKMPINTLTVHPDNPDIVWAGTGFPRRLERKGKRRLPQGLMSTADGGKSWKLHPDAVPRGEMVMSIKIFSKCPEHIYVATDGGVYCSTDAGKTFRPMMNNLPVPSPITDMDGMTDAQGNLILVVCMEADYRRENGRIICRGGVWRCNTKEGIWREITGNLRLPTSLMERVPDFKNGMAASPYSMGADRVLWTDFMGKPVNQDMYRNIVLDYHKDPQPFNRAWNEAKKLDASAIRAEISRWRTILPDFHTVRIDPRDPDVIYTSIFEMWVPYGIWKTVDGGKNWKCITRGAQGWRDPAWAKYIPAGERPVNIIQAWTTKHPMNYGTPKLTFGFWDIRKFDISKSNPDVLYFHTHRVTYRSDNGGRNWYDCSNRIVNIAKGQFQGNGDSNICVFGLDVHPAKPDNILFWMADCGLKTSTDNGKTLYGLPQLNIGSNQWVTAAAIDPADPNHIYAVFNCMDWLVGGVRGKYFVESGNFGNTFKDVKVYPDGSARLPKAQEKFTTQIFNLLVDPASPVNNRRFLATHSKMDRLAICSRFLEGTSDGDGIIESTDHGRTWHPANIGLGESRNIVDIVPVPGNFATIYAAAAETDKTTAPGGLFVSTDRGRSWRRLPLPTNITGVNQVVPLADGRIFIACGLKEKGKKAENRGGVFVSPDQGEHWQCLVAAPLVSTLSVNPVNPQVMYCTVERGSNKQIASYGIWRSADGGKSWRRVNCGIGGAYNLICMKWHPVYHDQLWIGTYGSGYYRINDPDVK